MQIFSERLKALRGSVSQSAFAKRLGLGQVTYGRYELGTREPDLETLSRIGFTLSVSVDYLLGLTDDPSPVRQGSNSATNSPGAAVGTGASVRTVPQPPAAAPWQCRDCPTVAALREAVAALSRAAVSPQ